jgi:hypothetical protein
METVARRQNSQLDNDYPELIKVRATQNIPILYEASDANPTVIPKGEVFLVNLVPMDDSGLLVGHYQKTGESFYVEPHEWIAFYN